MKKFIKYLTTGSENLDWGIYLNSAGSLTTPPEKEYPAKGHPTGYYFTWEQGRVLQEYQLNYITKGGGIFENTHGAYPVKEGSLMVVLPGEWHRYKPDFKTGWTENYVGYGGKMAENFMKHHLFNSTQPVIHVGERKELADIFFNIFDLAEKEYPGYQFIASGHIIKLLGYIIAFEKQRDFMGKKIAEIVEEARFQMRSEISKNFDLEKFAEKNNIGYSWFRRMFKNYTGLSPRQYCLQLKIMRAKGLLLTTNLSIKEISYELGFDSIYYFSRLFKQKTGVAPSEFRS